MTLAYDRITGYPLEGGTFSGGAGAQEARRTAGRTFGMAHDVFISYSHVDKATADATCATLERNGIRCWIAPRDILPGDEYGAAIVRAIDNCRAVILIFSASANQSPQIRREVERAINAGVPLIPVRIEEVVPTESLAYFMSAVHWLDAITPPIEAHLQRLAESVKALLQLTPGKAQPAPERRVEEQPSPAAPGAALAGVSPAMEDKPAKPRMFAEIMNFNYQRTGKQAFGWYLMYLLIGIVIGAVSGYVAGTFTQSFAAGFDIGSLAGRLSAVPYHILLGTLLIWNRKKDASAVLLVLGGVMLSLVLGALGGLIPFAFLSRRPVLPPVPYSPYMQR
jgi:TIR domain